MENKKPDNVVFSAKTGYNAAILPYGTNVGAPAIKVDDVVGWKSRGIHAVNKEFQSKFDELKLQYQKLIQEYEWNELVYNAKFSFEPVVGQIYNLYSDEDGMHFLSLIAPQEWNKEHVGTFKLNSDKKWILLDESHSRIRFDVR